MKVSEFTKLRGKSGGMGHPPFIVAKGQLQNQTHSFKREREPANAKREVNVAAKTERARVDNSQAWSRPFAGRTARVIHSVSICQLKGMIVSKKRRPIALNKRP